MYQHTQPYGYDYLIIRMPIAARKIFASLSFRKIKIDETRMIENNDYILLPKFIFKKFVRNIKEVLKIQIEKWRQSPDNGIFYKFILNSTNWFPKYNIFFRVIVVNFFKKNTIKYQIANLDKIILYLFFS
jgi:hypothetical protein